MLQVIASKLYVVRGGILKSSVGIPYYSHHLVISNAEPVVILLVVSTFVLDS